MRTLVFTVRKLLINILLKVKIVTLNGNHGCYRKQTLFGVIFGNLRKWFCKKIIITNE